jgi:hypothetical protein
VDQEQKHPERSFISELVPDWRPAREQVLWAIRITVVVIVVLLAILLLIYVISGLLSIELMNLLKLLALPITVGAAVPLLNWLQKKRELDVEDQRAQDEALQAYLDQMSQLMLLDEADEAKPKPLRKSVRNDEVLILARARTLTALRRLGSGHKRSVLDFLYEAELINAHAPIILLGSPDLQYSAADLSGADLRGAFLRGAFLGGITGANLSEADLHGADLNDADLTRATLSYADLNGADLQGADLQGANLSGANLSGLVNWTENQLLSADSFEGATMPDGQILKRYDNPDGPTFEEWLKDKEGRGQDGQNSGPL